MPRKDPEKLNAVNLQRDADRLSGLHQIADFLLFDLMAGNAPTITRHEAARLASAVTGVASRLNDWAAELGEAEHAEKALIYQIKHKRKS